MPEIGLGIGRNLGSMGGIQREILSWFNERGERHRSAEEQAEDAQKQTQTAQNQAQEARNQAQQELQARLAAIAQLHQMGLAPEQIAQALNLPK